MNEFESNPLDVSAWDCCDKHETSYLKESYCKDCRIEELEVSTIHDKWVSAMKRIEELEAQLDKLQQDKRVLWLERIQSLMLETAQVRKNNADLQAQLDDAQDFAKRCADTPVGQMQAQLERVHKIVDFCICADFENAKCWKCEIKAILNREKSS